MSSRDLFIPKMTLTSILKNGMQDILSTALWVHPDVSTGDKIHWMPVSIPRVLVQAVETWKTATL